MENNWLFMTTCGLLVISLLATLVHSHKEKPPLRKCGQRDVCRTSMKYKDNTVADEGLLCKCSPEDDEDGEGNSEQCPKDHWTEDDGRTLTWQHYERAHWIVQYRFCSEVFHVKSVCAPNSLAALVETDVKSWRPQVSKPRCICKDGEKYKLIKWVREDKMWRYYYECEKSECGHRDDPAVSNFEQPICAKIYINLYRSSDMVEEMRFECSCPKEFLCDARFDEKEDIKDPKAIYSDEEGKYVIKRCEPIVRKKPDFKKKKEKN